MKGKIIVSILSENEVLLFLFMGFFFVFLINFFFIILIFFFGGVSFFYEEITNVKDTWILDLIYKRKYKVGLIVTYYGNTFESICLRRNSPIKLIMP